ncbi:polyribonucleotide nucleotidyltransferase [Candidatus Parcubacteria bacterium]|nr:polyribonucleotide nucleotidyltransferase [Candidatus Parcubacteria bacterium]
MTNKEQTFSTEWLGRTLTFKTGKLARQADSCVTVQYGNTMVMATVVESQRERDGVTFFPLMVDFEERLYAAGIIKGSQWIKREGRPSDESILSGRMIDRALRPLFNQESRKDIQVVLTILSVDGENDHDVVALIAASAALSISGAKWQGPLGGVRVARINNEFIFNPTHLQKEESDLDLIVSGTKEKIIMIEAGAKEIKEDDMYEALISGQKELQGAISLIEELVANVEIKQKPISKTRPETEEEIKNNEDKKELILNANTWLEKNIKEILFDKEYYTKGERKLAVSAIKTGLDDYLYEQGIGKDDRKFAINNTVEVEVDTEITEQLTKNKKRVDGRKIEEIRQLTADVEILPRNHGAGLFSRGETQIMSIVTLGAPGLEQKIENLKGTSLKRFMHHYNFPAFSVGETRPMRGPGRREIGHGALAEKALEPVMPSKEDFPYTIRVVSETLGSNGSSSMGSTVASSLALMDAGVPIKRAVAGIAIGLASNDDMSEYQVITDIQDLEDGQGGMDFKITGTSEGITAIQLDTKTNGIKNDIVKEALKQGGMALNKILDVMNKTIDAPRPDLSPYAPRVTSINIDPDKIRDVIGAGGKIINEIIAECEVEIDIEDDGLVMVTSANAENCEKAIKWIKDLTKKFEAGEIYKGKVVRMLDFGAFIELLPGRDGMAHVSELAPYRIGKPSDFFDIGAEVMVRIKEIDDQGRVNLSLKGLPENEHLWKDKKGEQANGGFGGGFNKERSGNFNNKKPRFNNNKPFVKK